MKYRIAMWASAGFLVASYWALYAFATMPTMVRISHFSEPRTAAREGIEQLEVCFRIEEGLLITLAMNVHKKLAQLTKK